MSCVGLAAHLQGIEVDPRWPLSEDARGFYGRSSAAWAAAAIADGAAESSAGAAAERAPAFYSGEQPA